jgi:hypothetical protein
MIKTMKVIHLLNGTKLISEIQEVPSEIGEPDCKLINPFEIVFCKDTNLLTLNPWMDQYTDQTIFMIHSDKILTILDPNPTIIKKYQIVNK